MSHGLPPVSVAERLAERIAALQAKAQGATAPSPSERGESHRVPSPQGGGEARRARGEGRCQLAEAARQTCERLVLDVVGLAVAARNQPYMTASLAAWDDDGSCTAIGHGRTLTAAGAAFINGTAA